MTGLVSGPAGMAPDPVGPKLGVMASGRGSNFSAILTAIESGDLAAQVTTVISDNAHAPALEMARLNNIPATHIPYNRDHRIEFETAAVKELEQHECDLVILAGFMRLLTPFFVKYFPGRILNIHPSLLPAFKGLHAQAQAITAGVKVSGCTVHVVTEKIDDGLIIGQRIIPVHDDDTEQTLSDRILVEEHKLYPESIARYWNSLQAQSSRRIQAV